ncbi:elongator complex protein 5-like [Daphnia carinata]|uniref:elongator complex protein 5-like n=1 Tax=Daphnia carinata TaxID=120202 RepID=UPI0025808F50|nr:elongator complex protein 5-like [Daphnia carinata]
MILKDLLKQPPASILIQDSYSVKGRPLFLSLIHNYSENGYTIRYFKYDSPLSSEKSEMEQFKFPWQTRILNKNQDNSIESCWSSDLADIGERLVVAIDSLSPVLMNWTVGELASGLRNLQKTTAVAVVALIHGDVHDKETLHALNYIFHCHLTVRKAQGRDVCSGVLRKGSGKLVDSEEYYSISDQWEIKDVEEVTESSANMVVHSLPKNAVPKSTFKLDLNAKEEEARSQVVLPYIRKQASSATSETSKGQIIYEAEAPDWDDEDPDDDLEI